MIGKTFGDEVIAAGLGGLNIRWSPAGVHVREGLTAEQSTTLDAVIAAHNPLATPAKKVVPDIEALLDALVLEGIVPAAKAVALKGRLAK